MALGPSPSPFSEADTVLHAESILKYYDSLERDAYINPIARLLLAGTLLPSNSASPLREFRHCTEVLELIYNEVRTAWHDDLILGPPRGFQAEAVVNETPAAGESPSQRVKVLDDNWYPLRNDRVLRRESVERLARTQCVMRVGSVCFPLPLNTKINMVPIVLGDAKSVPEQHRRYAPMIEKCEKLLSGNWRGTAAYLTIHETSAYTDALPLWGKVRTDGFFDVTPTPIWYPNGSYLGHCGGVFTASSVKRSTRIWNATVPRLGNVLQRAGCEIELARGVLNEYAECVQPDAGELYWMADTTAHEILPLPPGTYRQYFRLVIGKLSRWWPQETEEVVDVEQLKNITASVPFWCR